MKLKLYRDKVISRVRGKDLVGVYVKIPSEARYICENCEDTEDTAWTLEDYRNGEPVCDKCGDDMTYNGTQKETLLAEMSPTKADKIINLWNNK